MEGGEGRWRLSVLVLVDVRCLAHSLSEPTETQRWCAHDGVGAIGGLTGLRNEGGRPVPIRFLEVEGRAAFLCYGMSTNGLDRTVDTSTFCLCTRVMPFPLPLL